MTQHPHGPRIRLQETEHQFQDGGLSGAAGPEKDLRMTRPHRERQVAQDHLLVELQPHLVEQHDWRVRLDELNRQAEIGDVLGAHQNRIEISNCVRNKSTTRTTTEAATTALVVARPTPCVPPLVRKPTWQPMVTITKPRKNGLMMPIQTSWMNSPSTTEFQYTPEETRSCVTAMSQPPSMPTVFATTVRIGHMMKPASTRGTTSLRIGSVPSARKAAICSVTIIEPSSAAIPEPTRPASINAVSTGPSSLIIEALISRPTNGRAPNSSSAMPDRSART